jgi:hypothetical protein
LLLRLFNDHTALIDHNVRREKEKKEADEAQPHEKDAAVDEETVKDVTMQEETTKEEAVAN